MSDKIAIIGAGVSGSLLAKRLSKQHHVSVFEKARGPGGRLSSLKAGNHCFDKGAQDFYLKDPNAIQVIEPALEKKILSYWHPSVMVIDGKERKMLTFEKKRFICGSGNINGLVKYFLENIEVKYSFEVLELEQKADKWFLITDKHQRMGPFDSVILTQPAQQVLDIAPQFKEALKKITYSSCMMLCIGLSAPLPSELADIVLSHHTSLRWLIQCHKKPGMISAPSLTLQSASMPYETLVNMSQTLPQTMLKEAELLLDQKLPIHYEAKHIWRYSKCTNANPEGSLWDPILKLGVIGDAFGNENSNGIESALLSAIHLSNRFKK